MNDSFTFGSEVDDIFASKSDTEGNTDFLNLIMNTETDESCDDEFDPQKTDNRAEKEADIEKTSTSSNEEEYINMSGVVAPEEPPSEEKVTDEFFGTSSSELESYVAFSSKQTAEHSSEGTTIEKSIAKESATNESQKSEDKEDSVIALDDFFNDDINAGNSQETKQSQNNNPLGDDSFIDKPKTTAGQDDNPFGDVLFSNEPKTTAGQDDNPFGDVLFSNEPKTTAGLDDNPFGDDLFSNEPKTTAGLDDNPFGDNLFSNEPKASAGLDENPFVEIDDNPFADDKASSTEEKDPFAEKAKKKEESSETSFPSLDDNPLW